MIFQKAKSKQMQGNFGRNSLSINRRKQKYLGFKWAIMTETAKYICIFIFGFLCTITCAGPVEKNIQAKVAKQVNIRSENSNTIFVKAFKVLETPYVFMNICPSLEC